MEMHGKARSSFRDHIAVRYRILPKMTFGDDKTTYACPLALMTSCWRVGPLPR